MKVAQLKFWLFLENIPSGSDVATACGRPVFELTESSDELLMFHLPKTFKHYMFYYACHPGSYINPYFTEL